jgi:hypothetical protein
MPFSYFSDLQVNVLAQLMKQGSAMHLPTIPEEKLN